MVSEWHSDRHAWKEHLSLGTKYDFLVIWIALSDTSCTGGGLELIPPRLCDGRDVISNERSQYVVPEGSEEQIEQAISIHVPEHKAIAFNSYTYHKSIPCTSNKTIWTSDFIIECALNIRRHHKVWNSTF